MLTDTDIYVQVISNYQNSIFLPYTLYEFESILKAMLLAKNNTSIGETIAGVELYLVDDAEISIANEQFMNVFGPTNILSFPGGMDLPGTLLLSIDTLHRECLIYGQTLSAHCLHLLAHGMAHLAQLDHGELHDALSLTCKTFAQNWLKDKNIIG